MKMRTLLFLFSFLLATATSTASDAEPKAKKNVCQVIGQVLDKTNAEALTGATVKILELGLEAYVDFDGSFSLNNVPAGSYTVEISMVSYPTKKIENFQIEKTKQKRRFFL